MKITAKFASSCGACGGRITVGSTVEWSRGSAARHVSCPEAPPRKADDATKVAACATVYEKWEPCKRAHLRDAVGETRRYVHAATGRPAGVYVVISQRARWESQDDSDDMGDMSGAGWQMTLGLRAATDDEAAKDSKKRMTAGLPSLFAQATALLSRLAKQAGEAEMARLEAEGCERVERHSHSCLDRAGVTDTVWESADKRSWIVRTTLPDGRITMRSMYYVYDWDQPYIVVAPADVLAAAGVADGVAQIVRARK